MKFTLRYIFENRYDINRNRERKLTERFIPFNVLVKFLSPYPTWLFLNLGIHPDYITFLSLGAIIIGAVLLVVGYPLAGASAFLIFGLLDSVDGDMARCQTKKTAYGGILDSFGADFFYSLAPFSIGFFLFFQNVSVLSFTPAMLFLAGSLTSLTFILYRLINAKVNNFKNTQIDTKQNPNEVAKEKIKSSFLRMIFRLYRHVLIRGNFFAEAGMIFWFFVLILFRQYNVLALYLVVILMYNLLYLFMNLIGSYIYFIRVERN